MEENQYLFVKNHLILLQGQTRTNYTGDRLVDHMRRPSRLALRPDYLSCLGVEGSGNKYMSKIDHGVHEAPKRRENSNRRADIWNSWE